MGDPNDNLHVQDHSISIGNNDNKYAKDRLGVTALIAIMEPPTDIQAFRSHKQPLKGCPNDKIKVLLYSGSDRDLFFLPKGKTKLFPI